MNSEITSEKGASRRDFLIGAGTFAAGALVAGGVVGAFSPRKAHAAAPALPWPYPAGGLDAAAVARAGYWGYKSKMPDGTTARSGPGAGIGGCMYGTVVALIEALAAATPAGTWDTLNPAILTYGKGGVYSWGTLCGSANGATAILQMVGGSSADALINEFMGWYCDNPFPSSRHDLYCGYAGQGTTVCKSPLCHQSAGKWAHENGYRIDDPQRGDRCAKVAGDCAYKVVEMLNAWKAGTLVYENTAPDYQDGVNSERCFACHVTAPNNNVQGRMDCLECHSDKVCHNQEI